MRHKVVILPSTVACAHTWICLPSRHAGHGDAQCDQIHKIFFFTLSVKPSNLHDHQMHVLWKQTAKILRVGRSVVWVAYSIVTNHAASAHYAACSKPLDVNIVAKGQNGARLIAKKAKISVKNVAVYEDLA